MAEIAHSRAKAGHLMDVYSWEGVGESDTCEAVEIDRLPYAYTVQAGGTFGGATVALHGSLDGVTYSPLSDRDGDVIGMTTAGYSEISTFTKFLRPVISGGSSADLNLTLLVGHQP